MPAGFLVRVSTLGSVFKVTAESGTASRSGPWPQTNFPAAVGTGRTKGKTVLPPFSEAPPPSQKPPSPALCPSSGCQSLAPGTPVSGGTWSLGGCVLSQGSELLSKEREPVPALGLGDASQLVCSLPQLSWDSKSRIQDTFQCMFGSCCACRFCSHIVDEAKRVSYPQLSPGEPPAGQQATSRPGSAALLGRTPPGCWQRDKNKSLPAASQCDYSVQAWSQGRGANDTASHLLQGKLTGLKARDTALSRIPPPSPLPPPLPVSPPLSHPHLREDAPGPPSSETFVQRIARHLCENGRGAPPPPKPCAPSANLDLQRLPAWSLARQTKTPL